MKTLLKIDPEVAYLIRSEIERLQNTLQLIASENYTSKAVLEAQGSVMTQKYAEGYPGNRYYAGCRYVDEVENLAIDRAKKLFKAEHANVQPHSGTQANMAVYFAILQEGDTILSMDRNCGGHLSHGSPVNFSGRFYKVVCYHVKKDTEIIDYDEVAQLAEQYRPKLIIAGASAYPRVIDFSMFKKIADSVGAYLLVDMAHIAGLIAANVHPSPIPYADFVTSTTHKTLRGPRSGFILCKEKYGKLIDKMVFPGIQGGPLMHVIAAKAVAFKEAMEPSFVDYQKQVVRNAKALAESLIKLGYRIVSGGTDTHLLLVDLQPKGITGKEAETVLESAGIIVNKNSIPYDPLKPAITSGIRLGTPSVTTRGMKESEMEIIAELIDDALKNRENTAALANIAQKVKQLCDRFPIYTELLQEFQ